jgi:hypothetical protein
MGKTGSLVDVSRIFVLELGLAREGEGACATGPAPERGNDCERAINVTI